MQALELNEALIVGIGAVSDVVKVMNVRRLQQQDFWAGNSHRADLIVAEASRHPFGPHQKVEALVTLHLTFNLPQVPT